MTDKNLLQDRIIQIKYLKKIMVVDDEPDVCFAITKMLEQLDCKVESFNDPVLAASRFRANNYFLVMLDIRMPKMDGFQLYQKIRKKDNKVKVCFITAYEIYQEQFGQLEKTDLNTFLKKPVHMDELRKLLKNVKA
jgi:DNA-binding NtrC family response regulator